MVKAKKSPKKSVKKTIAGKVKAQKTKSVSKKEEDIDLLNMDVPIKKSREEDKDTKLPETLQPLPEEAHPSLREIAAKEKEDKIISPTETQQFETPLNEEAAVEETKEEVLEPPVVIPDKSQVEHIQAHTSIKEEQNKGVISSYLNQIQEEDNIPQTEEIKTNANVPNLTEEIEIEDKTVAVIHKFDNLLNKKIAGVRLGVVLAVLIVFGVIAYFVYDLTNTYTANKSTNNPLPSATLQPTTAVTIEPTESEATQEVDTVESIQTLNELKEIISLDEENTTFALITDISLLNNDNPEFFLDAQNGDWLVILSDKKIALIYRPESRKIINIERAVLD